MKIRNGFVSNSSSSSFAIYGVAVEEETLCKLLGIPEDSELSEILNGAWDSVKAKYVSVPLYEKMEKKGLSLVDDGCGVYYIGLDIGAMKKTETLGEFGERADEKLRNFFKVDKLPQRRLHQGTTYDG